MNDEAELEWIDFVADRMYRMDCISADKVGPLWMCLDSVIRDGYRTKAEQAYSQWVADERAADDRRKARGMPHQQRTGEPA